MDDENKDVRRAVALDGKMQTQLVVTNGNSGDGRVISTPYGVPDIVLRTITPLAVILIRAAKTYVQSLLGFLGAAGIGLAPSALTPPGDFLHTLTVCAGLAVAPAVLSLLTNVSLLLSDLGEKFPSLKA